MDASVGCGEVLETVSAICHCALLVVSLWLISDVIVFDMYFKRRLTKKNALDRKLLHIFTIVSKKKHLYLQCDS